MSNVPEPAPIIPSSTRPFINVETDAAFIGNVLDAQSDVVLSCLAIIEERHKGNLSLTQAYMTYLDRLTEINHERATAAIWSKIMSGTLASDTSQLIPNRVLTSMQDAATHDTGAPTLK